MWNNFNNLECANNYSKSYLITVGNDDTNNIHYVSTINIFFHIYILHFTFFLKNKKKIMYIMYIYIYNFC